jgi:pSer/pThr/pTyr-binding forkhead associated (FHA) protein
MRVRLTEIKLRPTGKKVRIDREAEVESLFIGRGPDNDLSLKGLTISLHQATIRVSEGRAYVEGAPGQEVNVNGRLGSRPFNLEEMQRLYLTQQGRVWTVQD